MKTNVMPRNGCSVILGILSVLLTSPWLHSFHESGLFSYNIMISIDRLSDEYIDSY